MASRDVKKADLCLSILAAATASSLSDPPNTAMSGFEHQTSIRSIVEMHG
jgi:hypothetical protein